MSNMSESGSASTATTPDRLVINIKQEPVDSSDVSDCESSQSPYYSSTPPIPSLGAYLGRGGVQRIRHRYGSHIKQSVSPDTCVCEVCQAEFVGPQLLQGHKLCHFNSQHVCYVCDTYFQHVDTLVLHMATVHHQLNPATQGLGNEKEWFICPICLQKFSSKSSLVNHQKLHATKEKDAGFPCRVCGIDYNSYRQLKEHLTSSTHLDMKVKIQSVFVCVDCRSIFANRDAYAMHMMMRAQNEICQVNDASVTSFLSNGDFVSSKPAKSNDVASLKWNMDKPSALSYRLGTLQKTSTFTCQKCLQTFSTQDSLALHMMMHTQSDMSKYTPPVSLSSPRAHPHAPMEKDHSSKLSSASWLCKVCHIYCDSCDSLAMHMMMKHSNSTEPYKSSTDASLAKVVPLNNNNKSPPAQADRIKKSLAVIRPCSVDVPKISPEESVETERKKRSRSVDDTEVSRKSQKTWQAEIKNKYINLLRNSNSNDATWQCSGCLRVYLNQTQWTEHIVKLLNMKEQYYCHKCDLSYANQQDLKTHKESTQHEQKSSEIPKPSCGTCDWKSDSRALVRHHVQTQHGNSTKPPPAEPSTAALPQPHSTDDIVSSDPHLQEALTFIRTAAAHDRDVYSGCVEPINLCSNPRESRVPYESHHALPLHPPHPAGHYDTSLMPSPQRVNKRKSQIPSKSSVQSPESSDTYYGSSHSASNHSPPTQVPGPVSQSGISTSDANEEENRVVDLVLANSGDLVMCKHCNIIYMDKTLYHLHMGLHNLNDPWQCNLCGQKCKDLHEFTSHVLHN